MRLPADHLPTGSSRGLPPHLRAKLASTSGRPARGAPAFLERELGEDDVRTFDLRLSAEKLRDVVLLRLDELRPRERAQEADVPEPGTLH